MTALKPTNVPLTAKEFTEERCGVCFGCGCYCGYIAYFKEGKLIDLYGHPHDINGVGSFCTKGLTYIQQLRENPLRLNEPYLIKEGSPQKTDADEILRELREFKAGKTGIFLDRHTDLHDYKAAIAFTDNVYSDSVYLPFKASSLRPQEWAEQRLILALEFEPEFSEVMSARWVIDAIEKGAYLVSVSSRYSTLSSKAKESLLLNPYKVAKFLNDMALQSEGRTVISEFEGLITRLLKGFSTLKESVIIVGETLLRTPYRDAVLKSLQKIVKSLGINYSIVGNISPLPVKGLGEFIEEAKSLEFLITTGNPFRYMSDEGIGELKGVKKLALSYFPNITVLNSDLVLPAKQFYEREFVGFRNGFGTVHRSDKVVERGYAYSVCELLSSVFGLGYEVEDLLEKLGVSLDSLNTSEGGEVIDIPDIRDVEIPEGEMGDESELYLLVDSTIVEDLGHWNPWTHAIERKQYAYMSKATAEKLGLGEGDIFEYKGVSLPVKINNNVAEGVVFVPESFEEFQPFEKGISPGRLLKNPHYRVEELEA